jgi:hypothetical protein
MVATWPARTHAAEDVPDYVLSPTPRALSAQKSGAISKFKFMFGAPARWPGAMHWRYNHANAPLQYSNAKDTVIQQIIAESAKWTAVCGI